MKKTARPRPKPEQDEDEKLLDKFLVLKRKELAKFDHVLLDATDADTRNKVFIDEASYQRPRTSEVDDIKCTLLEGGYLISDKTAVVRRDGTIALADGGQTWRACSDPDVLKGAAAKPDVVRPQMWVRLYTFDNIGLEAQLFYVLNSVRAVNANIKIRAHGGPTATLLKEINKSDYRIWSQRGATSHLSAVAVVRALGTLLLPCNEEKYTDHGGKTSLVLDQTIGTSSSSILAALDGMFNDTVKEKMSAFLDDLITVHGKHPVMEEVVGLAVAKRLRKGKRFSKADVKALTSKGERAYVKNVLKKKNQRKMNIYDIGEHYVGRIGE